MVICDKYRKVHNEVAEMTLIGDVKGKNVILVDDIIDTGNTLCKAADLLMEREAISVRAMCTHPVLSGKAYETLANSSLVELAVSDSIPLKKDRDTTKIKIVTIADIFAEAITNTFEYKSIHSLFTQNTLKSS
jgi:ribose-phosphate pyrophosphokinase